jgi:hypothetical protein
MKKVTNNAADSANTNSEVVQDVAINPNTNGNVEYKSEFFCPRCKETSTFFCERVVTRVGCGELVIKNGEARMEGWRYPYKLDDTIERITCINCETEFKLERLLNAQNN